MKYDEIISLGYDCGIARNARSLGVRYSSYPFDWLVSLNTLKVFECIMSDFNEFTKIVTQKEIGGKNYYVNKYDMIFLHHSNLNYEEFIDVFNKKINSFYNALNSDKKILLIRTLHGKHEHEFCASTNNQPDIEFLKLLELNHFLNLKYNKIIDINMFITCDKCAKQYNYPTLFNSAGDNNIVFYDYIKSIIK
jgi:hypothetical protein